MGKIEESTILDILDKLIGPIKPIGETNYDEKVKYNLQTWAYIATVMVERLADVANIETHGLGSVEEVKESAESWVEQLSDGYHTFESLYNQRLVLFASLVNTCPEISWKSKKHSDGKKCFDGSWFIVGINTPHGQYTYHYKNEFWNMFTCKEIDRAPKWDGHTDQDVRRLLSISKNRNEEDNKIYF